MNLEIVLVLWFGSLSSQTARFVQFASIAAHRQIPILQSVLRMQMQMDTGNIYHKRRKVDVPSPELLLRLLNASYQKFDHANVAAAGAFSNAISSESLLVLPSHPLADQRSRKCAPILHAIPRNCAPILTAPNTETSTFFADLVTDTNPQVKKQIQRIAQCFPPPPPPRIPIINRQKLKRDHPSDDELSASSSDEDIDDSEEFNESGSDDGTDDDNLATETKDGIMIPFIFPRPPIIQPDDLPFSIGQYRKALLRKITQEDEEKKRNAVPVKPRRGRKPRRNLVAEAAAKAEADARQNLKVVEPSPQVHVTLAPLPFPPPHYMPYPLISDELPLLPQQVFAKMIAASKNLPRANMVVASAAGLLLDVNAQAKRERFIPNERKQVDIKTDPKTASQVSDDDYEFLDYLDYIEDIKEIDISGISLESESESDIAPPLDTYAISVYDRASAKHSQDLQGPHKSRDFAGPNLMDTEEPLFSHDYINTGCMETRTNARDIISRSSREGSALTSSGRERRRNRMAKSLAELDEYESLNREELYYAKRAVLVRRLKQLRSSRVRYTDSTLNDAELIRYERERSLERDQELVRLKLIQYHDHLHGVKTFYHDSNKVYRHLAAMKANKLGKLHNFFRHQCEVFEGYLANTMPHDLLNIKTKESNKVFNTQSSRDYKGEMKEFVNSTYYLPNDNADASSLLQEPMWQYRSRMGDPTGNLGGEDSATVVNDFMPVTLAREFDALTGAPPAKSMAPATKDGRGIPMTAKHQIFKSPLYDGVTSGSDGDFSEGISSNAGGATPKRRGRRANPVGSAGSTTGQMPTSTVKLDLAGYEVVHSEASLLAKIMKQFSGPQSASTEELNKDLEEMHVMSQWPR